MRQLAVDTFFEDVEEFVEGARQCCAGALRGGGTQGGGEKGAQGGRGAGGRGLKEAASVEEVVHVVCDQGGAVGGAADASEFAARPVHHDEDGVNVCVDVGEEARQFEAEGFEALGELVKGADDQRRGGHVGAADGFTEVPHCDAGFLKGSDLSIAIL